MQHWIKGSVTQVINETPSVKRFVIKPAEANFTFKPGQYITVDQSADGEHHPGSGKSYSVACAPGTEFIEIVIVRPVGDTYWYWDNIKAGSVIQFHGPHGKFLLPEVIDRDLYFICTGTGIAPFRAMLQHIRQHQIDHQNIYLVFGCRNFKDALFYSELKRLQDEIENFHYLPTFSRETANNHLLQRTGYVHTVYEEFIRRNMILNGVNGIPTIKPALFFLCGWQHMIGDAKERILMYGYHASDIQLEIFG
jgi:ferredoxin-NADP reductase